MSSIDTPEPASPAASRPHLWLSVALIVWLTGAVGGLWVVWAYENGAGVAAHAPRQWPAHSAIVRATDRPTLVLLAHPKCSCTDATLGELAEALARADRRPKTYVLFLKPAGFADGWEQTALWRRAAALPDVTVLRDDDGLEQARFGAETSGQTLLYDPRGTLVFSGGITGSRGHAGDNAGRAALLALLNGREPGRTASDVFGCPLVSSGL